MNHITTKIIDIGQPLTPLTRKRCAKKRKYLAILQII